MAKKKATAQVVYDPAVYGVEFCGPYESMAEAVRMAVILRELERRRLRRPGLKAPAVVETEGFVRSVYGLDLPAALVAGESPSEGEAEDPEDRARVPA